MRPQFHLSEEQVFILGEKSISRSEGQMPEEVAKWMEHLQYCDLCHQRVSGHRELVAKLAQLPIGKQSLSPNCPSEESFLKLSEGVLPDSEKTALLQHACECQRCAGVLKQAIEIASDALSPEEEEMIASLRTSDPKWQKQMSEQMRRSNASAVGPQRKWGMTRLVWATAAVCALALTVSFAIFLWTRNEPNHVEGLLAKAYSQRRSLDMRITGAAFASVHEVRGQEANSSRLEQPAALLEAESLIAKRLESHPDDLTWLHARGRAGLLEGDYENAIPTLEEASRLWPNDPQITEDLASAYFMRGERLDRSSDYGKAVDLLGQVIAKQPGDQVARFNRAIAFERIFLYKQAETEWVEFLRLDNASPWAGEARVRLNELRKKIQSQKERSQRPLLKPREVVAEYEKEATKPVAVFEERLESYTELAVEEWIPGFLLSPSKSEQTKTQRLAAEKVAQLLVLRHQDSWLGDFLEQAKNSRFSRTGLRLLVQAITTNRGTDLDRARQLALQAAEQFRATGNRPGEMRALFEASYSDQLMHQTRRCQEEARNLLSKAQIGSYTWLNIQGLLELATCGSMSDEIPRVQTSEALALAIKHKYGGLHLRAIMLLASLYDIMGDRDAAWRYLTYGLNTYWAGDYKPMRGFSFYAALDHIADDSQQWFLDAALTREALALLANDPDTILRAMEQQRLAQALLMTGDLAAAEANFESSRELFMNSSDGARRRNLETEAQIGLANIELVRSEQQKAVRRLEAIRPLVVRIQDKDISFDFFRNLGLAYSQIGDTQRAEQEIDTAMALAEESLLLNNNERDRFAWSRKTEPLYRAIVRLKLLQNPEEAFARWEWYRGASLRERRLKTQTTFSVENAVQSIRQSISPDSALLSYAVFSDGLVAWVYDETGAHQRWISVRREQIDVLAHTFAQRCSQPNSSIKTLQREGAEIYRLIFLPIEPLVRNRKHLIVEVDDSLEVIPFELLVSDGRYLAERFLFSFSPGTQYLAMAPSWRGVSSDTRALVVGDPAAPGWASLSNAQQEAKGVASLFRYSKLLVGTEARYEYIARDLEQSDIFHFAGHATASVHGAGLVLGDSVVFGADRLDGSAFRKTGLVVLSACSSGQGPTGVFDERDSLARVLIGSGVPEIVASRWTVDSGATAAIMRVFYRYLLDGKTPVEALHAATLEVRSQMEFSHPYYWASFAVFGKG